MYNRENVYFHNNKGIKVAWFQFTYKGYKSIVLSEIHTEGPSLTNSIESAISYMLYIMQVPVVIYQDCGDEGLFRVDYAITGEYFDGDRECKRVANISWHYFSKDLTSLELLYGKT